MNKRNLTRRELLQTSGAVGLAAAVPFSLSATRVEGAQQASGIRNVAKVTVALSPLKPPAGGPIPVAFVISRGAVLIDFAGPWEVFQDADIPGHGMMDNAFDLYTV